MSANELLALMRPDVETILSEVAAVNSSLPTCPSQSHRAKRAVEWIDAMPLNDRKAWFRKARTLRDFLTIHGAVMLLEDWEIKNAI